MLSHALKLGRALSVSGCRAYAAASGEKQKILAVLYRAGSAAEQPRLLGKPLLGLEPTWTFGNDHDIYTCRFSLYPDTLHQGPDMS